MKTIGEPVSLANISPLKRYDLQRRSFGLTAVQLTLLGGLFSVGVILLGLTVRVALLNTLLIFFAVIGLGLWLCHSTRIYLGDPKLTILTTFWLLKLVITLFLLYAGWIPQLDPSSESWGYDPQRYFQDAWTLIEDGWNPLVGSNYQGIIFYYGAIFYLFGHNPVIPALINSFVTLLGTLFIIRCIYHFVQVRTPNDWTLAWLILIPEVLWYDVMTSRETLMSVLIIIASLGVGRYLVGLQKVSLLNTVFLTGTAFFAILAVRTSMILPVAASIVAMALLLRSHRKSNLFVKVLVTILVIAVVSAGPLVQQYTGGSNIDYQKNLSRLQSFESNVASQMEWSDNSIGMLLAPNNAWQALLYLPPRMVLYLASPLPNVAVSLMDLIDGSWSAWQKLMTIPTSMMMLLGFPYVLAGWIQAWGARRYQPAPLVIYLTFWITFIAVAGGNIIIHERYRLMFTLLLFACMWFGYTRASRKVVSRWAFLWYGLLAASAFFYMGYKFIK